MKVDPKGSKSIEDFSFPIISNPFSNLMPPSSSSSSSLWRVSSRVFHHEEEYEDEEGRRMEVRSMCEEGFSSSPMFMSSRRSEISNVECLSCLGYEEWELDQERMDYLWEDFNHEEEEKQGKTSLNFNEQICIVNKQGPKIGTRRPSSSGSGRILIMGKLLKGLLSIKKSAQLKIMKTRS